MEICRILRGRMWFFSGTAETQRLPLEGKVPNAVRRMRWDAHHCFNLAAVQRTAGKHKGKTAFAAITPLHAKDATSSVGFRRQLPLEGKPNPAATQRLPLEGKVPNAVRQMRWSAHHRCGILSAATSSWRTTVHRAKATLLSLPCPHRKPEMPPHQSLSRQLPLEGKPLPRQKAPKTASKKPASFPLAKEKSAG